MSENLIFLTCKICNKTISSKKPYCSTTCINNDPDFHTLCATAKNVEEAATKFNMPFTSFRRLLKQLNITITPKKIEKIIEPKVCPKCNKEHYSTYGIHCSRSCANGRKHSEETKKKLSEATKKAFERNPKLLEILQEGNKNRVRTKKEKPAKKTSLKPTKQKRRNYRLYSKEDVINKAKEVKSIAGLLKALGIEPKGGNYNSIKKLLQKLNVDTSHWTGQGWNKDQQLKDWSQYNRVESLRPHLLKERGNKCEVCNNTHWLDKEIKLEIHHVDGDRTNNELNNLQLLCPNCHSFTDTWRKAKNLIDK